MASYLEIKKLIYELFTQNETETIDVDEQEDIVIPVQSYSGEESCILLPNDMLREAYGKMHNHTFEKLEMRSSDSLEIAIQFPGPSYFRRFDSITDIVNGIEYSIGKASLEYCIFILDSIAETVMLGESEQKQRVKMRIIRGLMSRDGDNTDIGLADLLRIYTLKVKSTNANRNIKDLRELASSFEFHYMYKKGHALSEYSSITDMYYFDRTGLRRSHSSVDTPPLRVYNDAVID